MCLAFSVEASISNAESSFCASSACVGLPTMCTPRISSGLRQHAFNRNCAKTQRPRPPGADQILLQCECCKSAIDGLVRALVLCGGSPRLQEPSCVVSRRHVNRGKNIIALAFCEGAFQQSLWRTFSFSVHPNCTMEAVDTVRSTPRNSSSAHLHPQPLFRYERLDSGDDRDMPSGKSLRGSKRKQGFRGAQHAVPFLSRCRPCCNGEVNRNVVLDKCLQTSGKQSVALLGSSASIGLH